LIDEGYPFSTASDFANYERASEMKEEIE